MTIDKLTLSSPWALGVNDAMSSRIVDADLQAMIDFREHLIRFNRTLAEEFASMEAHWRGLGDVWTDTKYHEFGEALQEAAQGVRRYLSTIEGHEAHLLGLIERLREYLEYR
jgi:hypothetical protein